jgi:type II secretion system protein N
MPLLVAGCIVLTLASAIVQFPAERLAPAIETAVAEGTGAQVRFGGLSSGLSFTGPALVASDVELRWPARPATIIDRLRVRPAFSFDWLLGRPTIHVDAEGGFGAFAGNLSAGRIEGELEEVDLLQIHTSWWEPGDPPLTGPVDASFDLTWAAGYPVGSVELESREGAVAVPDLPLAVPYSELVVEAELPEEGAWTLEAFRLDGPMVSASGSGTLGAGGANWAAAPVDLEVSLSQAQPMVRDGLASLGARLDPGGNGSFRITGTLQRPTLLATPR